ncbi:MAG: hypothetical protein ACYTFU_08985 [Planctomycetota bacterium]|jgi:uncharacterized protein YjeT (DUF2065 family)
MSDAQIFQVFSLVYLAIGIGMLINPAFYKKLFTDFCESAAMLYIGGVMSLVIGYLILALRGCSVCYSSGFAVIIPIIGWLALIKGILILVRPQTIIALTKAILKESTFKIMIAWVLFLGLLFSFLGFCPKSPI